MKKALTSRTVAILFGMLAILLITVYGCKNAQPKQEAELPMAGEDFQGGDDLEALTGYPLPTSYEVTELIYDAGASYIMTISNDPNKAGDYITQRDKALNLGVYGADLCYASTYKMKQRTMYFLDASKTLIDELGINTEFNMNYAERVENNLNDRDSIMQIVNDSFFDTWDHLISNKQDILARLVVSGSWIEGMYITTNIAETSRDNTTFLEILATQKNSLNKLVSLLEPVQDVNDISAIYQALVDLQNVYEGVGESLSNEQLTQIAEKVEALRETIV
ncbi:MAG: hypothetical protein ACWGNV_01990 [Bacteroidales bacterium]